jgi:hypothetical protein
MAGFCSCNAGIHAVHGNNLGAAPQARIQSFRSQLTPLTYIPVGEIDIETCDQCGGTVKVIACIEDPAIVRRILDHIEQRPESNATPTHPARAPPAAAQRDGS